MRKTKIVCTLGPANTDEKILRQMIESGMDVARFNFSHGTHEGHLKHFNLLDKLRQEYNRPVAALLDTKGPEIRLKTFKDGKVFLEEGQEFTLTVQDIQGDKNICSITYADLTKDVVKGNHILLDDGKIDLIVEHVKDDEIKCKVLNEGNISDRKGINVPGVKLSLPYLSAQDKADIVFGINTGYDFIAASFVRSAYDVVEIRHFLENQNCTWMKIIAKIENQDGVDNIDEIISASDGIMVARGDMGVEIDFTEIPILQKDIISRCYNAGKPVITATQMLESMITKPRPTRAEITDVSNAIYDGTSAIMLSGETAVGEYPVESVKTMNAIALRTEADINYDKRLKQFSILSKLSVPGAVSHAACTTAMEIKANAIVTVSKSGETARLLSKYRPSTDIIACVISKRVSRQLALSWGIIPLTMDLVNSTDELLDLSIDVAKKEGYLNDGDLVVITAGLPVSVSGTTNMIKVHLVGDALITGVGINKNNAVTSGITCVCRTAEEVKAKATPGCILVVPSTNNEMLPYIKTAAAVIAEDGGENSHTSIVGLTLDIPVIISAQGATRKVADNIKVSVDSSRGIIRNMLE